MNRNFKENKEGKNMMVSISNTKNNENTKEEENNGG